MDKSFEEFHRNILSSVEATIKSIELNEKIGTFKSDKKLADKYDKMYKVLTFWKEVYGKVSNEDDVIEGTMLLKNMIDELK